MYFSKLIEIFSVVASLFIALALAQISKNHFYPFILNCFSRAQHQLSKVYFNFRIRTIIIMCEFSRNKHNHTKRIYYIEQLCTAAKK